MRYIFLAVFFFLSVGISHAQQLFDVMPIPEPTTPAVIKFDSYDNTSLKTEKARLKRFASELKKDDYLLKYGAGFIVAYGGRRTYPNEALNRASQVKRYLVKKEHIEAGRLVIMDGGYRERWAIELFIVPLGAVGPMPTPTLDVNDTRPQSAKHARRKRSAKIPPAPNNSLNASANSRAFICETIFLSRLAAPR